MHCSILRLIRQAASSRFIQLVFVYSALSFTALELTEKSSGIPSDVQEDFFFMTAGISDRSPAAAEARKSMPSEKRVREYLSKKIPELASGEIAKLSDTIFKLSRQFGLNPKFILGVMRVESAFNPWAVSPKGALGLMQIMPDTGAWMARRLNVDWTGPMMLFDPIVNVTFGIKYLAFLKQRYGADMKAVLSAYNAGPAKFEKDLSRGNGYRQSYYKQVRSFLAGEL